MKAVPTVLMLASAALLLSTMPAVQAQQIGGGVQVPGDWWLGEGLEQGDFFSYRMCHVNYKECTFFEVDFWIQGEKQVGSETKWLAQAVVYDGGKIHKGTFEFGQITVQPSGGTENLTPYRSAMGSSILWLSAFATSDTPKAFGLPSWGKIANIGGEQVAPQAAESVTVPAGTFETIRIGWKTGGYHSHIWVVDEFPFPVKASTLTHVAEGIPPPEYVVTLLDYKRGVREDPFAGVVPSDPSTASVNCPNNEDLPFTFVKKSTSKFAYRLDVGYKPEEPKQGCEIDWLIKFKKTYDETEFLNQVQYDVMVVDDRITLPPIRSLADESAKKFLYSPSGLAERTMLVEEPAGENNYMIIVYGLAPEFSVPDFAETPTDYLAIPITVRPNDAGPDAPVQPDSQEAKIPGWVKKNAELWSEELIDDDTFVLGLQYLIRERIIIIPDTAQGAGSDDSQIPGWVKKNAELWSEELIDDDTFVLGIQYLIEKGIIRIA